MDNYVGEIRLFAGLRPPVDWKFCDGSACEITEYGSLYSIIGNTYGGDSATFNLPDLRGRVPVGVGDGPGSHDIALGEQGGTETVKLEIQNLPPHSHKVHVHAYDAAAADNNVKDRILAGANIYSNESFVNLMGDQAVVVGNSGGGLPHNNIMPVQALNFMICVNGIFPERP